MEETVQKSNIEKIIIHKACLITDYDGFILKKDVLNSVKINTIVRISMVVSPEYDKYDTECFIFDSPYVKIIDIAECFFLGEILDENRTCDEDKYPVRTGERIWFSKENIIEIPAKMQSKPQEKNIKKFRTSEKVNITGPLYTIIEEPRYVTSDSDSDSDLDSDLY